MKPKKIHFIVSLGVIVFAVFGVIGYVVYSNVREGIPAAPISSMVTTTPKYYSIFDGTLVSTTAEVEPAVLGVMIDNHPDARPQSGIAEARVVYEVPVEGGITRYFALFRADQTVSKVGPVRSARPYFLDWLSEYGNTSYWHCGGSPDALNLIKTYDVWDVNQYYHDRYFWRSANRDAPHNLYTNSTLWQQYFARNPSVSTTWQGWLFGDLTTTTPSDHVRELTIHYQFGYTVSWKYDVDHNYYVRYVNGSRYYDEAGKSIVANTLIVQSTNENVLDEVGRRSVDTIGTGEGRVLRDGQMVYGTWEKQDRYSRTRFYDANKKEIPLKSGQIWVQVISNGETKLTVTNYL